jgi:hypothetical protein
MSGFVCFTDFGFDDAGSGASTRAPSRAELATDAAERQRLLTFAIVVVGPTGVEMAGAISEAQVAISICDRLADGESLLAKADMCP